jgi:hypothetical protein
MERLMAKKQEKSDVSADVTAEVADKLKRFVAVAGGPPNWTDTIDSMLWRAAQRLGISQRRAKAFWYREAGGLSAVEFLTVQRRAQELLERQAEHARLVAEISDLDRRERVGSQRAGTTADSGNQRDPKEAAE